MSKFIDTPSGGGSSLPSMSCSDATKRRVTYFHHPNIGNFYYERDHNMKPLRIDMTHNLVVEYGLKKHLKLLKPYPARVRDLLQYHSEDYINFLRQVTPENILDSSLIEAYNVGDNDCPVFEDMFDFVQISAGGSIGAAVHLNKKDADIVINWAGGLHHAHKSKAAGFCYVNDIVLGIIELLKHHKRVLYIDIDIHHGDGVQEAFYHMDRVMTVSFHKHDGNFFPNNFGNDEDNGEGHGKYYSLNVPLDDGMDDESFQGLFKPIIKEVMNVYRPEAVVLQSGADSLSGDRIGTFNLTLKGHAECLRYLRTFNVPLMVLGGGGYTIANVARCWCYETAVAVGVEHNNNLPKNKYMELFGPNRELHIEPNYSKTNKNSYAKLNEKRNNAVRQISRLVHAPNMQLHERPEDIEAPEEDEEEMDTRAEPKLGDDVCMGSYGHDMREDQNQMDEDIKQISHMSDYKKDNQNYPDTNLTIEKQKDTMQTNSMQVEFMRLYDLSQNKKSFSRT